MNQQPPKIFVIILNWNGKEDTLACLKSLEKVSTPHSLIVVDNGSNDDSVVTIQNAYTDITLLENRKNLGYAEGNNVGIRWALKNGAEYLLILNNDTIVDPDILEGFLSTLALTPQASILGGKPYLMNDPSRLDHLGGKWNSKTGTFDLIGSNDLGENWMTPFPLDYVCGCALFVKAEVFRKVGAFESRFFLFWEESDFCKRAKKEGFYSYFAPNAKLWHKVSASFTGGKAHTTYFWWRNRLFFMERNCSAREKFSLFLCVIFPETLHLIKLYLIKRLQLCFLKSIHPQRDYSVKINRLRVYRASLVGIKDYIFRRLGNGPTWLFTK